MRRHTFPVVIGLSGLLGCFWINACSVDTNGAASSPNDASTTDGSMDSTTPEDVAVPEAAADAPHEAAVDAGAIADAHAEAAATCSAANCPGACCGNRCVAKSCAGCNVGTLFCPFSTTVPNSNGQCVSSCGSCSALGADGGVPCFSCASGPPVGTCAGSIDQCPATASSGACACTSGDAGSCPGAAQVCIATDDGSAPTCISCGTLGTQGLDCAGGQRCNEADSTCGN